MSAHNFIDHTGQIFSNLTVIERAKNNKWGQVRWKCKCICGNTTIAHASHLKNGSTKSCGCIRNKLLIKRNLTHGMYSTPEYKTWSGIIQRCTNPTEKAFENYGGRGITVCDEWKHDFMAFFKDMGKRPSRNLTIERVDNNKGYFPKNCIWEDRKTQANNRRTNHLITINGVIKTIAQWARTIGISQDIISQRLKRNWETERAIFQPVKKHK